MPVTADEPAPYAPPSIILSLIVRHRGHGLPFPVNSEVLGRAGVSESLIPRTLQALQALDLIDKDGKPTETFEGIRLAQKGEYKQRLGEWLYATYADVMSFVDPSKDDETKVRDAFRSYIPVGQQTRMVTLFLGLCAAAGLFPEKPAQPRQSRPAPPTRAKRNAPKKLAKSGSSDIPPPLAGLLASLPPEGQGWTQGQRDKFVNTFGAVLDFCIPIDGNGTQDKDIDNEEDRQP
ncbi:MAG: DUF5343 domain-containing protein [Proteobacteria bacterium]|nr:DUF5343 domain-containing protein [Pseudomonadota bacterium]